MSDYEHPVGYYFSLPLTKAVVLGRVGLSDSAERYATELQEQDRLVAGRHAFRLALEHSAQELTALGPALRRGNLRAQESASRLLDVSSWDRQTYLNSVIWLSEVVEPPLSNRESLINESVIRHGNWMGLNPSVKRYSSRGHFGTLAKLYVEAELPNTHRKFKLSREEALAYLLGKIDELGRVPSTRELDEIAAEDPSVPSYTVLYWAMENPLSQAARESGRQVTFIMSDEEMVTLGAEIMAQLGGTRLTEDILDKLSRSGLCFAHKTVINRFGRFKDFVDKAEELYKQRHEVLIDLGLDVLEEKDPHLYKALFENTDSNSERFRIYALYLLADELASSNTRYIKAWLASSGDISEFRERLINLGYAYSEDFIQKTINQKFSGSLFSGAIGLSPAYRPRHPLT